MVKNRTQANTAALYWDTVDTCYGTRTLDSLSAEGAAGVERLATVLAYNCPDIPHLPTCPSSSQRPRCCWWPGPAKRRPARS